MAVKVLRFFSLQKGGIKVRILPWLLLFKRTSLKFSKRSNAPFQHEKNILREVEHGNVSYRRSEGAVLSPICFSLLCIC